MTTWGAFVAPSEKQLATAATLIRGPNSECKCSAEFCPHRDGHSTFAKLFLTGLPRQNTNPADLDVEAFPIVNESEHDNIIGSELISAMPIPAYVRTEIKAVFKKYVREEPNAFSIPYELRNMTLYILEPTRKFDTIESIKFADTNVERFVTAFIDNRATTWPVGDLWSPNIIQDAEVKQEWNSVVPTHAPLFLQYLCYARVGFWLPFKDETKMPESVMCSLRVGSFCHAIREEMQKRDFVVPLIRHPANGYPTRSYFIQYAQGMAVIQSKPIPGIGKWNVYWNAIRKTIYDALGDQKILDVAACAAIMAVAKDGDRYAASQSNSYIIGYYLSAIIDREIYDEFPEETFERVVNAIIKSNGDVFDKQEFADWVVFNILKSPKLGHLLSDVEKFCSAGIINEYRATIADQAHKKRKE